MAEQVERGLDRDRVRRDPEELDRRAGARRRARARASTSPARKRRTSSFTCGPTTCVWTQTPPDAAELEERQDEVVVARVQVEPELDDVPRLLEVVRSPA